MQEEALSMQEGSSILFGSAGETRERLQSYFRLLYQVHAASRLLDNAERLRDRVPPGIFESVRMDYRKRVKESTERLEEERRLLIRGLRRYAEEREILRNECARLRESIKELTFRYVLGEYSSDYIENERPRLAQQFVDSTDKLTKLDEISDLLEIAGFAIKNDTEQAAEPKDEPAILGAVSLRAISEESGCSPSPEGAEVPAKVDSLAPSKAPESQLPESLPGTPALDPTTSGCEQNAREGALCLCILNGSQKGNRIPLLRGNMSIGRAVGNDIRIADPDLGRSHAMLVYEDGKYHLKNLDPLGRSYVNGIQVDSRLLTNGDIIALGEIRMSISAAPGFQ